MLIKKHVLIIKIPSDPNIIKVYEKLPGKPGNIFWGEFRLKFIINKSAFI